MSNRTCSKAGCTRKYYAKGLCASHYQQQRLAKTHIPPCSVEGCENAGHSISRRLCLKHYEQQRLQDARARDMRAKSRRAAHIKYSAKPEVKAAIRARSKAWRANNSERTTLHRETWRAANPERTLELRRAHQAARKARMLGNVVSTTDYANILRDFGMVCHICGDAITSRADLHFDHVVPLAKGGAHAPENIRPSHAASNLRKNVSLIAEAL